MGARGAAPSPPRQEHLRVPVPAAAEWQLQKLLVDEYEHSARTAEQFATEFGGGVPKPLGAPNELKLASRPF